MIVTKLRAEAATIDTPFQVEIPQPVLRQQFTVKQLDQQIMALQGKLAQLNALKKDAMDVINADKLETPQEEIKEA